MKKFLLFATCAVIWGTKSYAQTESFHYFQEEGKSILGNGMSPNGKYVVGADQTVIMYGNTAASGLSSFLWNLEKDTKEWLTTSDLNQLEKTGCFNDVNDGGIIVGYYKNPENQITTTLDGLTATMPINTAAVWVDGKVTSLGLGDHLKLENCRGFDDGTIATAISNDGETIIGNCILQNSSFPCLWKKAADGTWKYQSLELPGGENIEVLGGSARDISADGSIIVGDINIKDYANVPVYWKDGKINRIFTTIEDTIYTQKGSQSYAASISQNGEYISVVFGRKVMALYSVSKGKYIKIEQEAKINSIANIPVADNGNIMPTASCGSMLGGGVYYHPMWYSHSNGKVMDFSYFMTVYAPGAVAPFSFNIEDKPQAFTSAISTDASIIMGSHYKPHPVISTRKIASCWVLKARTGDIDIPQIPTSLEGRLTGFKKVTLTWPKIKVEGETYTLKSYNVYEAGKLLANIPSDDTKENYEYIVENATEGYMQYAISGIYSSNNVAQLESPKSDFAVVSIPNTFSLPLFEDLETGNWNSNFWTFRKEVENEDIFNYWGSLKYMGFKGFAGSANANTKSPYSLSAISRPMDATEVSGRIHVAFAIKYGLFEGSSKDLSKDSVSVDVSTDWGENWKEVATWPAEQLSGFYNFESVELTKEVAGKIFQIRLRAHGQGKAQLRFFIDQISVQEELNEAPAGIIASEQGEKRRLLMWKNSNSAYELNYMGNPYGNALGKTIGNAGKEIIGANLYDTEILTPFNKKYLSAVTTAFNWYGTEEDIENGKMDVKIMIWENNTLIREQSIEVPGFNKEFTVILNEPVQIDASKSLKLGIGISNYDSEQLPLLYVNSMSYVTGKSDLYSEDGGKTWKTLLEAFADSENPDDGLGAWRISANITDSPITESNMIFNDTLVAYNIYRDGEKINKNMIYSLQARFAEENPPIKGTYEVRAFYINGGVSPLSEELIYEVTGIDSDQSEQIGVYFDPIAETIYLKGKFNRATLYSINGQAIATTKNSTMHIPDMALGVYILKIELDNQIVTQKILKR